MKKVVLFLCFILCNCTENEIVTPPQSCDKDLQDIYGKLSKSATDYVNDKSSANCLNYKNDISELLKISENCNHLKSSEREGFEDLIKNLNCN
ncbi:hypothetical protein [uncultured Polaribacter sp.]|uniref:hypothetical protein n=1 Tax=uncultured Polaribacter sp. TaxID=174711 RepID=UPI00260B5DCB|nr:hypothetical protein [uncultured Polaribacter sp.]